MTRTIEYGECPAHHTSVAKVSQTEAETMGIPFGCQPCRQDLADRPDPATMTPTERRDELKAIMEGSLWAGFDAVWKRSDALVGRPIFTHEFAWPDHLYEEIMRQKPAGLGEVLGKIPADKRLIVMVADEEE